MTVWNSIDLCRCAGNSRLIAAIFQIDLCANAMVSRQLKMGVGDMLKA